MEELKQIKVLYVEDDDFIREHTSQLLKAIFKDVYIAKDGKEGVHTYNENIDHVDAIITDINMPELSGIDMARVINKMKEKLNLDRPPIIAVSAYSCEDYGFQEISKNFTHYLKKPIQIKELIVNVTKAINGEKGEYCK